MLNSNRNNEVASWNTSISRKVVEIGSVTGIGALATEIRKLLSSVEDQKEPYGTSEDR